MIKTILEKGHTNCNRGWMGKREREKERETLTDLKKSISQQQSTS